MASTKFKNSGHTFVFLRFDRKVNNSFDKGLEDVALDEPHGHGVVHLSVFELKDDIYHSANQRLNLFLISN